MATVADTDRVLACPSCVDLLRGGSPVGIVGARVEHPERGTVSVVAKETAALVWQVGPCPLCARTDTAIRRELLLSLLTDDKPGDIGGGAETKDPSKILEATDDPVRDPVPVVLADPLEP